MIARTYQIDDFSKYKLVDLDWHYPLFNDANVTFATNNPGVFKTTENEKFITSDFGTGSTFQICFLNERHKDNSNLPYIYELILNINTTKFSYAWTKDKEYYRENLKPHREVYTLDHNEVETKRLFYRLKTGGTVGVEEFKAWVEEQGIDVNNVSPEDKQLIKMRWGMWGI